MSEVRRTQVYLEPTLHESLRREAFAARTTLSARLREILSRHFKLTPVPKRGMEGLLEISGFIKEGLPHDVGRRHDDYLADDLYEGMKERRK